MNKKHIKEIFLSIMEEEYQVNQSDLEEIVKQETDLNSILNCMLVAAQEVIKLEATTFDGYNIDPLKNKVYSYAKHYHDGFPSIGKLEYNWRSESWEAIHGNPIFFKEKKSVKAYIHYRSKGVREGDTVVCTRNSVEKNDWQAGDQMVVVKIEEKPWGNFFINEKKQSLDAKYAIKLKTVKEEKI